MSQLTTEFESSLKRYPTKVCFQIKRGLRRQTWTYDDVGHYINRLLTFFANNHYSAGDRFLLWGTNMPEWSSVFIGSFFSGLIPVPADPRSNWETLSHYIIKTKPKFAIVSRYLTPFFKDKKMKVFELETFLDQVSEEITRNPNLPKGDDTAEIVFTSGSSSSPKGVIMTHDNIYYQFKQTNKLLPYIPYYESVSILPLSHLYEQVYGLIWPFIVGGTVNYLERINPLTIRKALQHTRATYLLAVPQMLRIFWHNIEESARAEGRLSSFQIALSISKFLPHSFRKILFHSIHRSFGGHLLYITSGSAPLEPKLAKNWELLGFTLVEGYGSTETTGMCTALPLNNRKFGTVGLPGEYTQIKIADNGEILIKGPIITPGYYQDTSKTKESVIDGWYHTGDIGQLDKDGFLIITGRISSRLVLSDGTKVYPEDIERLLNDEPSVKDSCIIGRRTNDEVKVHAVILPKKTTLHQDDLMKKINQHLESKQQINSISVWPGDDFPRLRSLKVDRKIITDYINSNQTQTTEPEPLDLSSLNTILLSLSSKKRISDSDTLGDDLKLDSLHRIELAALLEQHLGVQINELNLTPQTTIKELKNMMSDQPAVSDHFSAELITGHRRFSDYFTLIRLIFQKLIVFPIHNLFAPLNVIKGNELLDHLTGPYLIMFNHLGMFDLFSVTRLLPVRLLKKLATAATSERWEDGNRVIPFLMDLSLAAYPFARQGPWLSAGIEATGDLVDRGYSILFAPEGQMEREGKSLPFMSGTGFLAKSLNIRVLMFKIGNEYREIWPAPAPNRPSVSPETFFPKIRRSVTIKIGFANFNPQDPPDRITQDIEKQFNDL